MALWILVALAVGLAIGHMVPGSAGLGRAERGCDRSALMNVGITCWVPAHAHRHEAE